MQEFLISEYIKKMQVDDIIRFAKKKNIDISNSDAIILYTYAQKHYEKFIKGNADDIIKELKEKLDSDTFKKAYKLYIEYKIKYLN